MKFTEETLEQAFIELLTEQDISYSPGNKINRNFSDVILKEDLIKFLKCKYISEKITNSEIENIIKSLENEPSADLYESNKKIMSKISNGFLFKRDDRKKKDLFIQLIDHSTDNLNIFKLVNQIEIIGHEKRIPDSILYINGLPLVLFEFKTATRKDATIHDAYIQITTRYKRDIPELFKYNAFCVISDGVNNKLGSIFSPYEFYYSWRKIKGDEDIESEGIDSLFSLINGVFEKNRLIDILVNFIYFPDTSSKNEKIVCRYPQYFAVKKLYSNILKNLKPHGQGKGGTYFGATGCGKSYTMLFLTRLLMRSTNFFNPTIVLITDRNDLDDQLSSQFINAKTFIGDHNIVSVETRNDLSEHLKGRDSGGVFLTTIQKFTENTDLLSERNNIICISDEAHRSQLNLEEKIQIFDDGVKRIFGFAKYLRDSLPNATYVGFTGTPIDSTIDVFGEIVDSYTMNESVKDEITVRIVYEGRAAKVLLDNSKLQEIEEYYNQSADDGASEYAIEESKKATSKMSSILGDPDRIKALANDFVDHYETRISEGASIKGKAMFVSSSRAIAYNFYKEVIQLRPDWLEIKKPHENLNLSKSEIINIKPIEKIKMIMTRNKDDPDDLYKLLGDKKYRKELDRQFKEENSNFKIAIVVDMWLTGFDVPFLDTIYIDKPIKRHNLIQTISRVNRKYGIKQKGLVVDYIGIKKQMNLALAHYSKKDSQNIEDIEQSFIVLRDYLDLLQKLFHNFDKSLYFTGSPLDQLKCLKMAAEYVQITEETEIRFMHFVKRVKAAFDICCSSNKISKDDREHIYFYIATRSIIFKLTKGNAPDAALMNEKVTKLIKEAIQSDGIEEIFKIGDEKNNIDIFDEDYLKKIEKIKLPHTKIKLLQQLLSKAIGDFKKINKFKGIDFSKKFTLLVQKYNERKEQDVLRSEVIEEFTDEIIDLYNTLKKEKGSFLELGIDLEEKTFFDILKELTKKYEFYYPDDRLLLLSKEVKKVVDDKSKYTDWNNRDDIKAELKVDLIILLSKFDYPPVDRDEVYKEIFEQAENFKRYRF